jgi:outer membrane immunogenic protein
VRAFFIAAGWSERGYLHAAVTRCQLRFRNTRSFSAAKGARHPLKLLQGKIPLGESMGSRIWMSGVALAALLAPAPVYAQRYAQAPAYNWSGFYIGATGGGGSVNHRWQDVGDSSGNPWFDGTTQNFGGSGGVIGGYAGYNWQIGNLLAGVETDYTYTFSARRKDWPGFVASGYPVIDSGGLPQWTLRGRLGFAFNQVLIYATGGLAIGNPETRNLFDDGSSTAYDFHRARYGYVVGGGIEYMMTRNWIVRAEGLFSDFGTQSLTSPLGGFPSGKTMRVRTTQSQGRVGLGYRF